MPIYTCERCLKEFSQKSHYDKHKNKKKPCQDNKGKIEEVVENNMIKKLNLISNNKEDTMTTVMEQNNENVQQHINRVTPHTFIEVCAGAGGLSKGFIDAGFHALLLNDTDKYCIETLKANHPTTNVIKGSMVDLDLEQYKDKQIDVLMGGVPCQSFSQAGLRKGISDDRGQLIIHFIKMIYILNPKVFIIENVEGLLTHDKGNTLKSVVDEILNIGRYVIEYKVLNANDYSVPQNRKRLIIVGVNKSLKRKFCFPSPHPYKPILQDVLVNCPVSPGVVYKQQKINIMKLVPLILARF